jgi:apolipoprotein N-acyltransferase
MTLFRHWYVRWILSGLLLGIGFVFPHLWILGIGGGALFLYLLQQEATLSKKLIGAVTSWTIKAMLSVWFYWNTYPIEWLPLDIGQIQILLIFFTWFMTALCLGSGALFLVLVVWLLKKKTDISHWSYYILIYPLLWIIGESLGSLAFSIFFYGPGGTINTSFSFGYVGYLLAQHEMLLQGARLAGVYGLSFIFVCILGVLMWRMEREKKIWRVGLYLLILLYGSSYFSIGHPEILNEGNNQKVITVDTKISSRNTTKEGQKEVNETLSEAVSAALAEQPEYIILPEDSRYFDQSLAAGKIKNQFQLQYKNPKVVLVDSSRVRYDGNAIQQAFVFNGINEETERFHKRYLVPQGEFFSSIYSYILKRVGYEDSLAYLSGDMSYRVGPLISQSQAASNVPGILFCFESFAPNGVRLLTKERGDMPFVAHIASHAWFHEPHILWSQMETMMRVQAVWNQQYIVSAGNMVSGKFYTPNGGVFDMEVVNKGDQWEIKQAYIPKR